jgi:transposase
MTASAPWTAFPSRVQSGDEEGNSELATPEQVDVWVGVDVGKEEHFAEVLDDQGERIFARGVVNDEAAVELLLDRPASMARSGW